MRPRPGREEDSGRQRLVSTRVCVSTGALALLRGWILLWSCHVVALDGRRAAVPENLLLQSLTAASNDSQMPCGVFVCFFLVCFMWPIVRWREVWSEAWVTSVLRGVIPPTPRSAWDAWKPKQDFAFQTMSSSGLKSRATFLTLITFFLWRRWDEMHWNYGWAGARESPCCSTRRCQYYHRWCQRRLRADKCWLLRGTLKTAERIEVIHNHKYLIPIIACWELQHCLQNTIKHSNVKRISNANML